MAKHCDVCNQDYADDLPTCPHCAAAKKTHLAGRAEDRTTQLAGRAEDRTTQLAGRAEDRTTQLADSHPEEPAPHDSSVELGHAPEQAAGAEGGPASGASAISWSSLVEQSHGEEVKIDSPSDADLLVHEAEGVSEPPSGPHEELFGELAAEPAQPEAAADEEAEVIDLAAEPEEPAVPVSDSAVDLGAAPVEMVEDEPEVAAPVGGSDVFVAELASDASRVDLVEDAAPPSAPEAPADHDAIVEAVEAVPDAASPEAELTEEAALDVLAEGEHSSAVDLGAPAEPAAEAAPPVEPEEPVEVVSESTIDLAGLPVPEPSGSGLRSTSDSAVDLGSHADIGPPVPPGGEEAEPAAVADSGVTVGGEAPPPSGISDMALESLLSEESATERPPEGEEAEEAAALADEEPVAAAEAEEAAALAEEPVVSESEVDELLAGLEETPAPPEDLAAMAEEQDVNAAIGEAAAEEEAAAAEQEAAEEAAEEEEKPARPVKQRSRIPALMGGTLFGLLLGAGGLLGARFAGIDVAEQIGVAKEEKKAAPNPVAQKQGPSAEARAAMLRNGDWDEAAKAGVETIQESNPEELAVRGDFRLNSYLHKSGSKVNLQDPPLQQAIADLQKAADAKVPLAIYDLGLINELANNLPKAKEEYTKGVNLFQNDPFQKRRFQSALDRVELREERKAGGAAFAPSDHRPDRAALLALLLVGLQAPQPDAKGQPPAGQPPAGQPPAGQPPQAQGEGEEAGFDFWQAVRMARDGKYPDAIKALDHARQVHDGRRFTRLRKAQNPLSDPTEDIFLRCCDELKKYWLVQSELRKGDYLTEKNTPVEAVQELAKKSQASADALKALTEKLVAEKVMAADEDPAKGLDKLLADRKDAEAKVADLTKELKKATDEATTLADKLKTTEKTVKDLETKLADAGEEAKKLKAANDGLNASMKKIADDLAEAKFLEPKEKPDVGESVRKALEIAKMKDPEGVIRKQRGDLARLNSALKERRTPEEMLPLWLLLLDENRTRPELSEQAALDVNRVKADPEATGAQKGQADVVLGLALRNAEKFGEAKRALEAARSEVDKGEWLARADVALKEVTDPAGYFSAQAEQLYDRGQMGDALGVLERALKVVPEAARPKLLARRSLIELDAALSLAKGKLTPRDAMVVAARRDADEAAKANLAEGHYAAGRIAEELGQLDAAIASYRKALEAHPALDADGGRYRVALARVLSQPREGAPLPPAGGKVGWSDPAPYPARHFTEARSFLVMAAVGLQPPEALDDQPGLEEAEKRADEILNAPPGTMPFDVIAQAQALKGRWTLALQTYAQGVRPLMPRRYANGLSYLVLNHPRLKRPDSLRTPNPAEAARLYASGLNFYFDRDYANAERALLLAVENDSQDARYFYFLGLARLAQNRRNDALADFDTGAMLERLNRPSPAAVSESLERVQGATRRIVNNVRNRPER